MVTTAPLDRGSVVFSVSNIRKKSPNVMLSDPLVVSLISAANESLVQTMVGPVLDTVSVSEFTTFHLVDLGNKSSKRNGNHYDGNKAVMSVNHSLSKENKPYDTDRTLIRFDESKIDTVTGRPVTMSAYQVIALPQGGAFTTDDAVRLGMSLALFSLLGGYRGVAGPNFMDVVPGDTLRRLIDGEA